MGMFTIRNRCFRKLCFDKEKLDFFLRLQIYSF